MSVATVSQAIASQHEALRPNMPELMMLSGVLWKRINSRTDIEAVSNRPTRVPFNPLTGGIFRTGANLFDGAAMGVGSGPVTVPGYISCVSFLQASAYTKLTEYSTDSKSKSIENFVTLTQKQATKTFAGYMDALMQSDGSNTLDSVVSTTTNGLVVHNANKFQDGQLLDIWTALAPSGSFVATVQILSVDILQDTIWLTGPVPGGTTGGYLLLVNGSAGLANSGFLGLRYYHAAGNVGNYMGIQKSSFAGKFSTPNINFGAGGGTLTPASVRALEANIILSMGEEEADAAELVAHMNVDMSGAWENNAIAVQSIILNQVKGDESADMLKRRQPQTMGGREILRNPRATPGLIDFIALKNWFRIETAPVDYYEVGGQTVFPQYGGDGGVVSAMLFYLVTMVQAGLEQPRIAGFINNVTIPKGYFGQ